MNLTYKILWIDDNDVSAIRESIATYLEKEGFNLEVEMKDRGTNIKALVSDPNLDLILLDYHLPGRDGDELVQIIRSLHNYTEIIFYTQGGDFSDAKSLSGAGVFTTPRGSLTDTIKSVLHTSIRKSQDIVNMRGLVIAETIDLEMTLRKIILNYFGGKTERIEYFFEYHTLDFSKTFDFLKHILKTEIANLQKQYEEKTGEKRQRIGDSLIPLKAANAVLNSFSDEIIGPRNMLAHVEEKIGADNIKFLKPLKKSYQTINCNQEWCKKIRKDILKHSKNLDATSLLLFGK